MSMATSQYLHQQKCSHNSVFWSSAKYMICVYQQHLLLLRNSTLYTTVATLSGIMNMMFLFPNETSNDTFAPEKTTFMLIRMIRA